MGLHERDDTSSLYSDSSENRILPKHTVPYLGMTEILTRVGRDLVT